MDMDIETKLGMCKCIESALINFDSIFTRGFSCKDFLELAKYNFGDMRQYKYGDIGLTKNGALESMKRLYDDLSLIFDPDTEIYKMMTNIITTFGLANEHQLVEKVNEAMRALIFIQGLVDIVNGNIANVQLSNTEECMNYISSLITAMSTSQNNNMFVNYNALVNENAILKAKLAQYENGAGN